MMKNKDKISIKLVYISAAITFFIMLMVSFLLDQYVACAIMLIVYLKILWRKFYNYTLQVLYKENEEEYNRFKKNALIFFKMEDASHFSQISERMETVQHLLKKYTQVRLILIVLCFLVGVIKILIG